MSGGGTKVAPLGNRRSEASPGAASRARAGVRPVLDPADIARRRLFVIWAKRLLPVGALILLSAIVLWPEIARQSQRAEMAMHALGGQITGSGHMVDARYRGVDNKGQPYTVTAAAAAQAGPDRVNLTDPKADLTQQDGSWLYVRSRQGVFLQHDEKLDLSDHVWLYRDDGTTLSTSAASINLPAGAAAGAAVVNAEGPFGTLDATGFALQDRGAVIQFTGPARLLLNNSKR